MRIHNLYEDAAGVSHFRDVEVEWKEQRGNARNSAMLPATGVMFRERLDDYDVDWHPAPRRQYVINLSGGVHITAGDGETRYIGPGEIVLVEDTTGRGHISKFVGGALRHMLFVAAE